MIGLWEWILLTVGLLSVALIVALIAFQVRCWRHRGRNPHSCGRCGYQVRGLPTFICPECGSDLREVGIVAGSTPNALVLFASAVGSGWLRLLLGTVAIAALMAIVGYVLAAMVLTYHVYPGSEAILATDSGGYRVLLTMGGKRRAVDGWLNASTDKVAGETLSIRLARPGEVFDYNTDLQVDLATWSSRLFRWVDGRSSTPAAVAFSRQELERFFEEGKIDLKRPEAAAELDELMVLIDACRSDLVHRAAGSPDLFRVVSGAETTTVAYAGRGPIGPVLVASGAGLWVVVMAGIVIVRMYRLRDGVPRSIQPGVGGEWPEGGIGAGAMGVARTVTVLFSDIKDYTARSAAAARSGAIELVRRHRDLAVPIIRQRRGLLIKTVGDALLATFESATDAVLAGLEIQAAVRGHNAAAEGEGLQLRIAVASGEVIVEAGDVYGQTVNLASRLQGVAPVGEVVLSAATRALVNESEVLVEPSGEHRLAGFASPVQAFVARAVTAASTG